MSKFFYFDYECARTFIVPTGFSNGTVFDFGISLYKADATMTKFDKLSLINCKAEPTLCK